MFAAYSNVTISIPEQWIYGIAAAVILGLLSFIWHAAWKRLWPWLKLLASSIKRVRNAEAAVGPESRGLWLAPSLKLNPPAEYGRRLKESKPIIVVANLKGGVGKTTTVANLIAHYALAKKKRVLAIDMDFQGSLSASILSKDEYHQSVAQQQDGHPSKSAQLVDGRDASWLRNVWVEVQDVPAARCIPTYYSLSAMENRVMVEWIIGKRSSDVRYTLAETLLDRGVQELVDIILIDAPPRLTTATVQSLCAATHVLVPTVLDGLSSEAASGFATQLAANQSIWPHLKLLGVFGNMTAKLTVGEDGSYRDGQLLEHEAEQIRFLEDAVSNALQGAAEPLRKRDTSPIMFPEACFIPDKAELGKAATERIAYKVSGGSAAVQQLSRAFDRLGDEIDRRL